MPKTKSRIVVPKSWAVQPLKAGQKAINRAECGVCGLACDDGKVTSMTPAPASRCPFESFHDNSEPNHALEQAKSQLESIKEMVRALHDADEQASDQSREEAENTIHEDALEVEVRNGWYSPGTDDHEQKPEEYKILLCTGGPAVRIVGNLSDYNEPESATIEYQDWGTPWTEYRISSEDEQIVLEYARCFYFGE